MRLVILVLLLGLSACASFRAPPPLPASGPILYTCADGTQLMVEFESGEARVAIVGGYAMVLPSAGTPDAPYYTNGRYGLRGGGREAAWQRGRAAPVSCRGS